MTNSKKSRKAPPVTTEAKQLDKEAAEVESDEELGKEEFGRENP